MANKRVFSGIQPSGDLHIGNYLGAMVNWVRGQGEHDNVFCIVDLHAITVPQDPKILKKRILENAKMYLAAGIDPKKSTLFVQSDRPEHSELAWILNCFTYMGEMNRMTQFKEKSNQTKVRTEMKKILKKQKGYTTKYLEKRLDELKDAKTNTQEWFESVMLEIQKEQFDQEIEATIDNYFASNATVGLFDYPVLMAADILLYDTDEVPVGDDQKQHVEIARDIAKRVNNKFGKVFTVPEPIIKKEGARIMSLVDPTKKMAKSDDSENSYVLLRDNADTIYKKFARATTDSENVIKFDKEKKPGISNLLNIMSVATETPIPELEKKYADSNYGEFKKDVADCVIELLKPLQEKLAEYDKNEDYVRKVLKDGAEAVAPRAQATLERVKKAVGLGL